MTKTLFNLPLYRTHIPVNNIPWDEINDDIEQRATPLKEIDNGFSTIDSKLRRDLEPWAETYRQAQLEVVRLFMPYAKNYVYPTWLQGNWINKTMPGGILKIHDHYPCDIATCWYLDIPANSGNFVLIYNDVEYEVPVSSGDFLAFPATLLHRTQHNNSSKPRFIMGGNIVWHETLKNDLLKKMSQEKTNEFVDKLYRQRQVELFETMKAWFKEHNEKNITQLLN